MSAHGETPARAAWDARVSAAGGHLLQSWAWGELKVQFGWGVERVAAGAACAQVLFRAAPGGLGSLAYVPRGPAADFGDGAGVRALLEAIRPSARKRRAICLKVEPNCEETPALEGALDRKSVE